MIEGYRGASLHRHLEFDRLALREFSDANQSMTIFKMRPRYIYKDTAFALIPLVDNDLPVHFSQTIHLPISKRHAVGVSS